MEGILEENPEQFDLTVERISDHQHRPNSLADRLTARQLEALEVAYDLGFFAVPRDASLAEVAMALDCSESAASTLIRSGVEGLVEAAIAPG